MDIVSPRKRSEMMSNIKGKDTKPEVKVRKALFKRKYRYSLHNKKLPGKPDIVLGKYKTVIFVNGCFWHGHNCHLFKMPKTRTDFWKNKIAGTKLRDVKARKELTELGWHVITVWECSIKGKSNTVFSELIDRIDTEIKSTANSI